MDVAPIRLNEIATAARETPNSRTLSRRATKIELAARYSVGIRTIENWQCVGVIRASFEQGRAVFNIADCDERLLSYKSCRKPFHQNQNQ